MPKRGKLLQAVPAAERYLLITHGLSLQSLCRKPASKGILQGKVLKEERKKERSSPAMARSLRMAWKNYPQIIQRDAAKVPQMSREVIIPDLQGHICRINWPPQLILPLGIWYRNRLKHIAFSPVFIITDREKCAPSAWQSCLVLDGDPLSSTFVSLPLQTHRKPSETTSSKAIQGLGGACFWEKAIVSTL